MAAGLGFKTFNTGDVLSAADTNGYLMQGVLVFANATARDAAITSPQEGQFAFTKDNDSLWYYSGSAWVSSGATGDIEGVTAGVGISGGGTSGTVTVTNSMATAIDAKGDLIGGTGADTFARLAVGANDTVLTADSSTATGLKWAAAAGGSSGPTFRAFRDSSDQTITINTATKIQFNAETWDTDSCFDSTTNYRFTANKAGYYQFNTTLAFDTTGAVGRNELFFYKNGAANTRVVDGPTPQAYGQMGGSAIIYLNGTTDYVEVYVILGAATTRAINFGTTKTMFDGVWIRS
jgi:hypothetical protein